jgi:type I restriction enzyme S subunit
MSFPTYAHYKDSGVEWLGEVPAHWGISTIKHIVSTPVTDGPHETPQFFDEGIPFVSAEAVSGGFVNFEKIRGHISELDHARYSEKYKPKRGDIFMVKSGATTGLTAIVETDQDFNIWSPLAVIRSCEKFEPYYVLNFMRSKNFQEAVTLFWSFGTQQNIGMGVIENLEIAFPPIDEQREIAQFLTRETIKLDALITEQRTLIDLLKEKRQAVISHAVTKGLDPRVPMKDSGVEWLGEVPAHWELSPLRRAFTSMDYGVSASLEIDGAVAVLRMGNISGGKVSLEDLKYLDEVDSNLLLRAGDLLFNRTNSLDQIGKVGLFVGNDTAMVSFASYLVRLRTTPECVPEFFGFLLNCAGVLAEARANAIVAIGQCNLNPTRYGAFVIAIPPRDEQLQIAEFLNETCAKLDGLIQESDAARALLIERRSALISAAVTGKIDVRQAA